MFGNILPSGNTFRYLNNVLSTPSVYNLCTTICHGFQLVMSELSQASYSNMLQSAGVLSHCCDNHIFEKKVTFVTKTHHSCRKSILQNVPGFSSSGHISIHSNYEQNLQVELSLQVVLNPPQIAGNTFVSIMCMSLPSKLGWHCSMQPWKSYYICMSSVSISDLVLYTL